MYDMHAHSHVKTHEHSYVSLRCRTEYPYAVATKMNCASNHMVN